MTATTLAVLRLTEADIARFWSRVDQTNADGCWPWIGALRHGYGVFWWGTRATGKQQSAPHRIAYLLQYGAIPAGLQLDHLCRHRACARPDHLEAVTQRVNLLRGQSFAARNAAKTTCPANHPYSGSNLRLERDGSRKCRSCRAARLKTRQKETA